MANKSDRMKDEDRPEDETDPVVLEADAEPRGMASVAEQYERNMKIIEARIRRQSWSKIADEHKISTRRCQQIWSEWSAQNKTLRHHKPLEIVDEMLYGLEDVLRKLGELATSASQDSVRVGALNSMRQTWREIAELLQATGVLPNDLGTMHHTHDIEVFVERMMEALDTGQFTLDQKVLILNVLGGPTTPLEQGDPSLN